MGSGQMRTADWVEVGTGSLWDGHGREGVDLRRGLWPALCVFWSGLVQDWSVEI
jgi:hypothetical protein